MRPTATLRHFLCIASGALLCISYAHAADVAWDITPGTVGAGDSLITGGTGAWDTTNGNWTTDSGANNLAWVNANNDTAIFGDTFGLHQDGNDIYLTYTVVPEPDVAALLGGLGMLALLRRRRN